MPELIHTIFRKISAFLFPESCLGCGVRDTLMCENCRKRARSQSREPAFAPFKVLSYGLYNSYLRDALLRFKYNGAKSLTLPLAKMLYELIKPHLFELKTNALILPIPISSARRRMRGYNQTELLARALSDLANIPASSEILFKSRPTPSQTSLSGKARMLNVKDSFSVKNPEMVRGKKIILVDDVLTTGATLSEAGLALKNAGAKKIIGLVVART